MGKFRENNRNGGGFNRGRDSGFGGGRSFGGNRSFGGSRGGFGGNRGGGRFNRDGPKEMFDAKCSKCGNNCQLPFKPRGDKPVYCSACFETEGQTSPRFEKSSNSNNSSPGISQEQFKQINTKLDKILAVLSELEIDEEMDGEDLELDADEDEEDDDSEN